MKSGLAFLLAVAIVGCGGGDDEDEGDARGGSGGTSGTGGSSGSGGFESPCFLPEATFVAEPRVYGEGSPIVHLAIDGDQLFFGTLDEIYSVPTSGGEPMLVYPPEPQTDTYPPFWVVEDDLVVGRVDHLDFVLKTGGELTRTLELPVSYSAGTDGRVDFTLASDGRTFYGKNDPLIADDEVPDIAYFDFSLDSEESMTLLEGTPIGHGSRIVPDGDFVYVSERVGDANDPDDDTPDELYRIPFAGGDAEAVTVDGAFRFDLVAAADGNLIWAGRPAPFDIDADFGGFYRIPSDGGAPERIVEAYVASTEFVDVVQLDGRAIIWSLREFYEAPPTGEGTLLFTANCSIRTFAATETDVYIASFDDVEQTAQIVRAPLR